MFVWTSMYKCKMLCIFHMIIVRSSKPKSSVCPQLRLSPDNKASFTNGSAKCSCSFILVCYACSFSVDSGLALSVTTISTHSMAELRLGRLLYGDWWQTFCSSCRKRDLCHKAYLGCGATQVTSLMNQGRYVQQRVCGEATVRNSVSFSVLCCFLFLIIRMELMLKKPKCLLVQWFCLLQ